MGNPRFDRTKRYVSKKGQKFGKGIWLDDKGSVIKPGQGIYDEDTKTVTQYNTDGTKTVFTREQWHHKKTLDHETKVLQNDRAWGIPYIPEKKMTLTIDKDSPTSRNRGATFSENVLDSIAINAKRAGIPFSTGLGIASTESTIGNNSERTFGESMLSWLRVLNQDNSNYGINASNIPYDGYYSPTALISNWTQISENPFAAYEYNSQGDLRQTPRSEKYYEDDFESSVRKDNKYTFDNKSPLQSGFEFYKANPAKYNHNDPTYTKKVKENRNELVNHSPEIKAYMKKHNLHSDGGSLNSHWDSLSQKEKAEMIRVAIQNGITTLSDIKQAYNEFAKGGPLKNWTMEDEAGYRHWRQNLPKNLRDTNDDDYDMRAAYKAGTKPMWNDADKSYHLSSRDPETGRIFKAPHHPTYLMALGEDAKLGYYPTIDKDGNTYTETWEGNTQYPREIEIPYKAYGGNLFDKGGKKNSSSSITTQRAMDYLMSRGISRTGAAAIVGTLQAESSLDPTIHAKMKGDDGEGLAQWTGSRKKNFWKVLEGIEPGARRKYGSISNVPFERQIDVVLAERPDVMQAISNAGDVQSATDVMLRGFENGGGTIGTLATKEQMDKIYGKWNNGYDKQMTKRLGNANSILGITIEPSTYEIPQTFFDDINSQIAIPQIGLQQSTTDIDPEFRYKHPVIDETMFQPKPIEDDVMKSIEEENKQNRLQKINTFNTIMGLMGQTTPLTGLGNTNTPQGLLDYVGQIYS